MLLTQKATPSKMKMEKNKEKGKKERMNERDTEEAGIVIGPVHMGMAVGCLRT